MPEIKQEVLIDLLELLQDMKKAGYVHVNPHHQSYLLTELEREMDKYLDEDGNIK